MSSILIIEDERIIRETVVEILEMSDYEVFEAENGVEGLREARENMPDIVVCDVMMPKMDGMETIKSFKSDPLLKNIPFIFFSALSEMSDLRKGMNMGAEDYITKPFQSRDLLTVIDLQLKKFQDKQGNSQDVNSNLVKEIKRLKSNANQTDLKWNDCLKSAGRIQSAILPKKSELDNIFRDYFNYYKPKYQVSGDFYWAQNYKNLKLIAVADCTGHGVPASLLTICCYNGLNVAVKHFKLRKPGEILRKVNELVLEFMQEHGRTRYDVGMDIVICAINEEEQIISFAGARRPLYIVSDELNVDPDNNIKKYIQRNSNPLFKIKGGLFTIGSPNKEIGLQEYNIQYKTGDTIYLCSDGYSDQFGGDLDKRFKSGNLIQLLQSVQKETMIEQKKIIAHTFGIWKGETEQTDDVTLFGIRL